MVYFVFLFSVLKEGGCHVRRRIRKYNLRHYFYIAGII